MQHLGIDTYVTRATAIRSVRRSVLKFEGPAGCLYAWYASNRTPCPCVFGLSGYVFFVRRCDAPLLHVSVKGVERCCCFGPPPPTITRRPSYPSIHHLPRSLLVTTCPGFEKRGWYCLHSLLITSSFSEKFPVMSSGFELGPPSPGPGAPHLGC